MSEVANVNATNCFNSSDVAFASVFSTVSLTARSGAAAAAGRGASMLLGLVALGVGVFAGVGL